MEKRIIISSVQLLSLVLASALMLPYTFLPVIVTPPANQDVWIVPMLSIVYKIIIATPLLFIINKFRGIHVNDIFEIIMGKIMGKVFALITVIYIFFVSMVFMSMAVLFISASVFPETPSWAIALYMVVPVVYAASKGGGTLARLATFIVPYILITIIVFLLMSIKDIDLFVLKPVLVDSSLKELNKGAFLQANRMTEMLIFLVFCGNLKPEVRVNSIFWWFLVAFTIAFTLILVPTIAMLGLDLATHIENPYFVFTKQVKAYDFIQRLESFNVLGWFLGMILKLSISNYMASCLISGVIKLKTTYKSFVIPIGILVFVLTLLPQINKQSTVDILRSNKIFPWATLVVVFIIPIIMVIVYFVRKNKILNLIKQKQEVQ